MTGISSETVNTINKLHILHYINLLYIIHITDFYDIFIRLTFFWITIFYLFVVVNKKDIISKTLKRLGFYNLIYSYYFIL
jgi:hypothetical protein